MLNLRIILQSKKVYLITFCLLLIYFLGVSYLIVNKDREDNQNFFVGTVLEYKIDGNAVSILLKGKERYQIFYTLKSLEEKEYFMKELGYGCHLKVTGVLNLPSNNTIPNTFNYQVFLKNNDIHSVIKAGEITINPPTSYLSQLKNKIVKKVNSLEYNEYLNAFILGDSSDLDQSKIRQNGISHLFALSGMHLSLFILFLTIALKGKYKNIFIILFLTFYLYLTNFHASIMRAYLFYIISLLNKKTELHLSHLQILFWCFVILVFIDPFIIYDIGFEYSFILCFFLFQMKKETNYFKLLLKTSILAFLVSLPISAYYFYQVNVLSILFNLFFVPFVTLLFYPLSLATCLFSFLRPLFHSVIILFEFINNWCSSIRIGIIVIPKCSIFWWMLYYILFLMAMIKHQKRYLVFCFILVLMVLFIPYLDNKTQVYYLDVGQGDSTLLLTPHHHHAILIDTGGQVTFKEEAWKIRQKKTSEDYSLVTFFHSLGMTKIDTLILTHGDADHMGTSIELVKDMKIDHVIFNFGSYNDLEESLQKILDARNISYQQGFQELNLPNLTLKSLNTGLYENENDNSNVIYSNIHGYQFLLMGDASTKREKGILDKYHLTDIDFLKVGHHGSDSSSSEEFINQIKPKYSLISVGKNNRYGHPKDSVLDLLKNSNIYRTDKDGSIEIKLNKSGYKIITCPP